MANKGAVVLFAACCILVSIPVSYLVNAYRMANSVPPSDSLAILIKFLPFIALSIVLIYGAREVVKLANLSRTREATHFIVILAVLLAVAIVVELLTFNLGVQYIL